MPCAGLAQAIPPIVCFVGKVSTALFAALVLVSFTAFFLEIDLLSSVEGAFGVSPAGQGNDDNYFDWRQRPLTIATIATRGFDARALVESLRGVGDFKGDIVVLSDGCSPEPDGARYVVLDGLAPASIGKSMTTALEAKTHKTRLFELAAPTSSSSILYIDADVEANQPLEPFLERLRVAQASRDLDGEPPCEAWFNYERWWHRWKQGHSWQGGFFFLPSAAVSGRFLDAWGAAIASGPADGLDQSALARALFAAEPPLEVCELPRGDMSYVPDIWSALAGPRATTFTHWTKSSELPAGGGWGLKATLRRVAGAGDPQRPPRRVNRPDKTRDDGWESPGARSGC